MSKGCHHFDNDVRGSELVNHSDHEILTYTIHTTQHELWAQARVKCYHGVDEIHANREDSLSSDGLSLLGAEAKD